MIIERLTEKGYSPTYSDQVVDGILIPFQNLLVWSDDDLAAHGFRRRQETPVVVSDPVPNSISDRQFFQQLAIEGKITQAEALAAVKTGELPKLLQDFVDTLPESQRFTATMLLSGAKEFQRQHPMTIIVGNWQNMSDAEVDQFFRNSSQL